jgi:hypothetical protein
MLMMVSPVVGSEAHKELFCRTFIETHDPYDPATLPFPDIAPDSRARLLSLPIWDEAVNTERETAMKVARMTDAEPDPLVRQAIALQGFEEHRHAALLDLLTQRYEIPVKRRADALNGEDPAWDFIRTEYGECFDAFFAFGLFAIARDSGFFPPPLVTLFDPVMQEEARHILFFVNWMAYRRARLSVDLRSLMDIRRAYAVALQMLSRIRTAFDLGGVSEQDNFTMKGHEAIGEFSIRVFLDTCLRENERRLGLYDARLLRPRFAPRLARTALRFMRS